MNTQEHKARREAMKMIDAAKPTVECFECDIWGKGLISIVFENESSFFFEFESEWTHDVDPSFDGIHVDSDCSDWTTTRHLYYDPEGNEYSVSGVIPEIFADAIFETIAYERVEEKVRENDDIVNADHHRSHYRQYAATYRW